MPFVTVAWYTMLFVRRCPSRAHWSFFLQLHSFTGSVADGDVRFRVWHAGMAEFRRMSVEDLVKRMVSWKTFVHDVEGCFWALEFQGGLYHVRWRAFLWFRLLVRLFIGEFEVVSAFVQCFLARENSLPHSTQIGR